MAYIINFALIFLIYIIIKLVPAIKNKNIVFLRIAFIELFLFLALRKTNVGIDLAYYLPFFKSMKYVSFLELQNCPYEYLYSLYNKIIYTLTNSSNIFLAITAAISLIGPYFFIKRYSKNYFLSIVLFIGLGFYGYHFLILRQIIALSILLISTKYIEKKKFMKFALLVIIATLFHKTSILFIIVYFIAKIDLSKKCLLVVLGALLGFTFLFRTSIIGIVMKYFYSQYVDIISPSEGYNLLILMLILLVGITFLRKYKNTKFDNIDIFYNIFVIGIFIQILATYNGVISRLNMDYFIYIIVLLPNIIEAMSGVNNKEDKSIQKPDAKARGLVRVIKLMLVILVFVFLCYSALTQNYTYSPYFFFWQ